MWLPRRVAWSPQAADLKGAGQAMSAKQPRYAAGAARETLTRCAGARAYLGSSIAERNLSALFMRGDAAARALADGVLSVIGRIDITSRG